MDAQKIYLNKMSEAVARIGASEEFLESFRKTGSVPMLEASVLQMRKALECVAYAAIAPNKNGYERFRKQAENPADYRKDYNAKSIFTNLSKINPDFYPSPLLPAIQLAPGRWHYDQKSDGFLTKKRFEAFYDRLGKYLHADNPWGSNKGVTNLVTELPTVAAHTKSLLSLHRTIIRASNLQEVWVVAVPEDGSHPHMIKGQAFGEFTTSAAN